VLLQYFGFRWREDAIETAQDGKGQNHLPIFVPFVGAAEQITDAPDEICELSMIFSGHEYCLSSIGSIQSITNSTY